MAVIYVQQAIVSQLSKPWSIASRFLTCNEETCLSAAEAFLGYRTIPLQSNKCVKQNHQILR
jgi:hypothetical protein